MQDLASLVGHCEMDGMLGCQYWQHSLGAPSLAPQYTWGQHILLEPLFETPRFSASPPTLPPAQAQFHCLRMLEACFQHSEAIAKWATFHIQKHVVCRAEASVSQHDAIIKVIKRSAQGYS